METEIDSIILTCIECMKFDRETTESFPIEKPEGWRIKPFNKLIGTCPKHKTEWGSTHKKQKLLCRNKDVCGHTAEVIIKSELEGWEIMGEIEGICLLCEIRYLDIPQPRSAQTVLKTLTKILGIEIDLSELELQAEEMEQKLEKIRKRRTPQEDRPKEPRYIS